MSLQLRSLLWKEWHERKWSLAPGTAWIMLGVAYTVGYESAHRVHAPVASFYNTCMVYGLFAAVFLAMRTALGEVSQGTLGFSLSLPASQSQQAWVRLGGALSALVGPIVLGALVFSLALGLGLIEQAPARSLERLLRNLPLPERQPLSGVESVAFVWTVAALAGASSVQLLLILAFIGARRRAEPHVGFIGACAAFVWLSLQALHVVLANDYLRALCGAILPQTLVISYGYKIEGASYGDLWIARWVWLPLAGNLLVLTGLAWGFARRYGTRQPAPEMERSTRLRWQLPAILSRLPIRWPGRVAALVWLDLRQAVPMCLAGIVLACLMTAVSLISESGVDARRLPDQIAGQLAGGTWIVGLLWGAVVGAGVFAGELAPRLEQFWRSRPISPSAWFWVKYLSGLAAVLGVLDLVTILAGWNSPHGQGPNRMSIAYIACMPFLHALTYALAVLGTCWFRRPVLAAAAAVLFFFLVSIAFDSIPGGAEFDPIHVYNNLLHDKSIAAGEGTLDLTRHGYPIVYGGMAALIVLASVAAWRGALRPHSFRGRVQA